MKGATVHHPDTFMHALAPSAIAEPSLRERKLQRTRQTIIDEASKLFRKHGYSTTTLKDIAEAAETSVATIMRYFGSKDAILLHREHVVLGEISAHVRARAYKTLDEGLRDVTRTSMLNLPGRVQLFGLIANDPEYLPIMSAMRAEWEAVLAELFLQFSGDSWEEQVRAKSLAAMMTASGLTHMTFWHENGMRQDLLEMQQDLIDQFIEAFIRPIDDRYAAARQAKKLS
jgi:AcrR family transcriptional regulator